MYKVLIFLVCLPSFLFSQAPTERDIEIAAKFEYRTHDFENINIPYRIFIPDDYDSLINYPLVLAMHGAGQRGSDNNSHILGSRLATSWADSINQEKYPCFVICPQVPTEGSWVDFYGIDINRVPISPHLAAANDIVTSIIKEFNIDTTRLYATGLSMGGEGTWDLILRFPDRYACAIPMSGGGDQINLANSLHTPIWNFHGRIDTAVPIEESTRLINKFNSFGRDVLYTHCNSIDCSGLTELEIQNKLNEGSDLIHTEYEDRGHVIWTDSYNYPLLFPWVFKQYFIKNAIEETSINSGAVVSNQHELNWETEDHAKSIDIYYSKDFGYNWTLVERGVDANVPYLWNTLAIDDAPFATLKLIPRDDSLAAFSYADSKIFTLDNDGNGTPFVGITNKQIFDNTVIESDEAEIKFLAADPEWADLNLRISYSNDDGVTFEQVRNVEIESSHEIQTISIALSNLLNSPQAILKLEVSDGENSASDYTYRFSKQTLRNNINEILSLEKANFDVPFDLVEIDPGSRNDHRFTITFNDTSSKSESYYTIFDNTTQSYVTENEKELTIDESAIFGGLSFKTSGEKTSADAEQSGWNENSSQQSTYTMSPFVVNDSHPEYDGYAAPFDYMIEFYDNLVESSTADTLANLIPPLILPSVDVDFKVKNVTTDEYVDFVYFSSGSLVKTSTIYFLEELSGWRTRTWRTLIYSSQDDFANEGDTLFLNTYKGLSIFDTVIVDPGIVGIDDNELPNNFTLEQNYPNPFNPATTIEFSIPHEISGEKPLIKLTIFDVLGRELTTLIDKQQSPGRYKAKWDASGFSSGVYFYRLTISSGAAGVRYSDIRKMVLLK